MNRTFWWKWTVCLGLAAVVLTTASCDEDEDDPKTMFAISGNATGAQEVPPVTTSGTGTLTGSYNSTSNLLTYNITWTGLSAAPVAMHFHGPAPAGENASPIVHIMGYTNAPAGNVSGTATLTDAQETDLMNGLWYYNLHTPNHTAGEIRAQVLLD